MRSEKPDTKLENVIMRKHAVKYFGEKMSLFGFQWKYVESIASNSLMQVQVSFDDSTSNYSEKHERYKGNRNHRLGLHVAIFSHK